MLVRCPSFLYALAASFLSKGLSMPSRKGRSISVGLSDTSFSLVLPPLSEILSNTYETVYDSPSSSRHYYHHPEVPHPNELPSYFSRDMQDFNSFGSNLPLRQQDQIGQSGGDQTYPYFGIPTSRPVTESSGTPASLLGSSGLPPLASGQPSGSFGLPAEQSSFLRGSQYSSGIAAEKEAKSSSDSWVCFRALQARNP